MIELLLPRLAYLLFIIPFAAGTYFLLAQRNLYMALMGLYLVQTAVILFFVLLSVREGATVPILGEGIGQPLANPLPQALMLTAIVVGVATLGVGLAILRKIQSEAGTLRDDPVEGDSP